MASAEERERELKTEKERRRVRKQEDGKGIQRPSLFPSHALFCGGKQWLISTGCCQSLKLS